MSSDKDGASRVFQKATSWPWIPVLTVFGVAIALFLLSLLVDSGVLGYISRTTVDLVPKVGKQVQPLSKAISGAVPEVTMPKVSFENGVLRVEMPKVDGKVAAPSGRTTTTTPRTSGGATAPRVNAGDGNVVVTDPNTTVIAAVQSASKALKGGDLQGAYEVLDVDLTGAASEVAAAYGQWVAFLDDLLTKQDEANVILSSTTTTEDLDLAIEDLQAVLKACPRCNKAQQLLAQAEAAQATLAKWQWFAKQAQAAASATPGDKVAVGSAITTCQAGGGAVKFVGYANGNAIVHLNNDELVTLQCDPPSGTGDSYQFRATFYVVAGSVTDRAAGITSEVGQRTGKGTVITLKSPRDFVAAGLPEIPAAFKAPREPEGLPEIPAMPKPAPAVTPPPHDETSGGATPTPPPGGDTGASKECQATHTVVRGDTLNKIAARYGVTVAVIQAKNSIANANSIGVGQRLCIPPKP